MKKPPRAHSGSAKAASPDAWPLGASVDGRGVRFRVWAPDHQRVEVELMGEAPVDGSVARSALPPGPPPGDRFALTARRGGYFAGELVGAGAGLEYRYVLDDGASLADPTSRYQPAGVDGPSRVVDAAAFAWSDQDWPGVGPVGRAIYELHVGTWTREGTWAAATERLPELVELGIDLVEILPVAEFAGDFGWGYDGVFPFAPYHGYGSPDDFRRFVDRAHGLGIAVILDVVYNHLGPRGNVLPRFASRYLSRRHGTDWGSGLNFDGRGSAAVRELVVANAAYWIRDFHLDGLRLDATQDVKDDSPEHVLGAIVRAARQAAAPRPIVVVAENEPQDATLALPPEQGGAGVDLLWNDDFHHTAMVAATGHAEAYYSPHAGSAQELVSAAKHGFLYQGQRYSWQNQRRGRAAGRLEPWQFVHFLQNHDQVANSARGARLDQLTSAGRLRALTALLLLGPQTPMLFQGQEWADESRFVYFADHPGELGEAVRRGRLEFLAQFPSLRSEAARAGVADPLDPGSVALSKLVRADTPRSSRAWRLHRDLLRLRRQDPVFSLPRRGGVDGAVLGAELFVLRFFSPEEDRPGDGEERLLLVNLGGDRHLDAAPEPLLAPPAGGAWRELWSSEDPTYGGGGASPVERDDGWHLPGHAAMVLGARPGGSR